MLGEVRVLLILVKGSGEEVWKRAGREFLGTWKLPLLVQMMHQLKNT